jgi:Fe-S-cluster containining protein
MSGPQVRLAQPPSQPKAEPARCDRCDAVCCRLTVVLMPQDDVPARYTTVTDRGLTVMARDEDGWCVAIDQARMCCGIYAQRPQICRRFVMAGPYCRDVRADYLDRTTRGIPLVMY